MTLKTKPLWLASSLVVTTIVLVAVWLAVTRAEALMLDVASTAGCF
jgi:uncharacterized membrane protein